MAKDFKAPAMSAEEAKAFRAKLFVESPKALSDAEKKEAFRVFWTAEKGKYKAPKDILSILWIHLKAAKLDSPVDFEKGLKHFGLKKVK